MKKLISLAIALAVIAGFAFPLLGTAAVTDEPSELYLHVGSPIAMSDGKTLSIDSENPDLAPIIHKDRTLVPLRFISEFFGAEVDYDEAGRAGVVTLNGKTATFPMGESYYLTGGERVAMDTQALNISGRIFLPLRVLCEDVLGRAVAYRDGVVAIAEKASLSEARALEVKSRIGMYIKASSLEDIKAHISESGYRGGLIADVEAPATPVEGDAPSATPSPEEISSGENGYASADEGGGSGDHSTTNTQVEGVDEADIIKTDGRYIYLLGGNRLTVVSASDTMSIAARLTLDEDQYAQEMYVDGDRLVIVGARHDDNGDYYFKVFTVVSVYDISDLGSISLLRTFEIEGYATTTRKQGDYVYLLSNLNTWSLPEIDPRPLMGEDGDLKSMPVSDVMIMPGEPAEQYLTLSAINIQDKSEKVESESILGGGYVTYMSNKAMYVALENRYYTGKRELNIARFSINGAKIGYAGSGEITGYLNDQFSMDEYNGYLRVASTVWDNKHENNLYVLDDNMQVCGSVLGFAPGETIYSVRFMGSRGYVVTFKQIDPLFVFDLSDPANPRITGELKVPGFSSYLHPVSEDVILGVGYDVKDVYVKDDAGNEVIISQQTGGIKLSLFDVSDMGKPKEIDTLVIGERGYSELLSNHKAAMFKADDSLLAFPMELYSYSYTNHWSGALVVSYLDNRLAELGRIAAEEENYDEKYYYYFGQRLVYIGDTLYYAQGSVIRSFDLDTLVLKQSLSLK